MHPIPGVIPYLLVVNLGHNPSSQAPLHTSSINSRPSSSKPSRLPISSITSSSLHGPNQSLTRRRPLPHGAPSMETSIPNRQSRAQFRHNRVHGPRQYPLRNNRSIRSMCETQGRNQFTDPTKRTALVEWSSMVIIDRLVHRDMPPLILAVNNLLRLLLNPLMRDMALRVLDKSETTQRGATLL